MPMSDQSQCYAFPFLTVYIFFSISAIPPIFLPRSLAHDLRRSEPYMHYMLTCICVSFSQFLLSYRSFPLLGCDPEGANDLRFCTYGRFFLPPSPAPSSDPLKAQISASGCTTHRSIEMRFHIALAKIFKKWHF